MDQFRLIPTDFKIEFAWLHDQIVVLVTKEELIGYSSKVSQLQ
jgi:hypothetical protein